MYIGYGSVTFRVYMSNHSFKTVVLKQTVVNIKKDTNSSVGSLGDIQWVDELVSVTLVCEQSR